MRANFFRRPLRRLAFIVVSSQSSVQTVQYNSRIFQPTSCILSGRFLVQQSDMQYVRSIGGSVSKTWNSINPATLSGAIDVIVVEQEDGACDFEVYDT